VGCVFVYKGLCRVTEQQFGDYEQANLFLTIQSLLENMTAIAITCKFYDATSANGRRGAELDSMASSRKLGPNINAPHALNDFSPLIDAGSCF
jgi:hypothetical protein